MYVADRITMEPGKLGGKPCIRGRRIRVQDVLELLAGGTSTEEILADYPSLEAEDIPAALAYAAEIFGKIRPEGWVKFLPEKAFPIST